MTPHALLTAIAAAAFGFAVIIGSVAGSAAGATPGETRLRADDEAAPHAAVLAADSSVQSVAWNDPCTLAV